jgi:Protein of unknown function (DUF3108)
MNCTAQSRAISSLALACTCALAAHAYSTPATAAESKWAPRISAEYRVNVAGLDIGTFNFVATVKDRTYSLAGYSKLKFGLGLVSWVGRSSSSGTLSPDPSHERAITPAGYHYEYKMKKKSGGVRIGFDQTGVNDVKLDPPRELSMDIVPTRPEHVKDVFDPMSALIALSHGLSANPCGRRVGVFDGKQRFDIELSFRRQERVVEKKPSGQPPLAFVCRVRYVPVAGHKNNKAVKEMARNDRIEVAMRPIPAANMLVPYRITIPTSLGTTYIYARKIDIVTPNQQTIALAH